jgi:hypothetical protein
MFARLLMFAFIVSFVSCSSHPKKYDHVKFIHEQSSRMHR